MDAVARHTRSEDGRSTNLCEGLTSVKACGVKALVWGRENIAMDGINLWIIMDYYGLLWIIMDHY